MNFHHFQFDSKLQDGLDAIGFSKPTPVQEQAIPVILSGQDIIACAQTGTGKTAAYLLPVIHRILATDHRHLNTLILAPTRELAVQIDQQVEGLAYFTGVSSISVFGGGDGIAWDVQRKALEQGADIVIATPGRLIAMLATGTIDFSHLRHLVLDEADRMLDMGFFEDIIKIISYLPTRRQTLLFSATMPPKIRMLANTILQNPASITLAISKPAEGIVQQAFFIRDEYKIKLLGHILKTYRWSSIILFASTKEMVKKLGKAFEKSNLPAKAFHSDIEQQERTELMRAFKNKQIKILIGTDVLSRGIDVEGISMVINWDVPPDPEDYVHRIGRTARAESTGTAITFVNSRDMRRFQSIEELIGRAVDRVALPEGLGPEAVPGPRAEEERSHRGGKRKFVRKKQAR